MKILIVGGDGMLGHQLLLSLGSSHEVHVTLHQAASHYSHYGLYHAANSYDRISIQDETRLRRVIADFKPAAVINAIGIVKQRQSAKEAIPSIEVNALFPHRLALLCQAAGARLVHMSTDCVFSGRRGAYTEQDLADADDLYGKTKYLGEVCDERHCITLRSSIIGLELSRKTGLIEWFLAQRGSIRGFTRAIYSGLSTLEMARVIESILMAHPHLSGVWHVASAPINKYELLTQFSARLGRQDIHIEKDDQFICDRHLDGSAFQRATGYQSPSWAAMLQELAAQTLARDRLSLIAQTQQALSCNA